MLDRSYPSSVEKFSLHFNDFDNEASFLYIEIYGFRRLKCVVGSYGSLPWQELLKDVWFTRTSLPRHPNYFQTFCFVVAIEIHFCHSCCRFVGRNW